jgi:hypothetical protein
MLSRSKNERRDHLHHLAHTFTLVSVSNRRIHGKRSKWWISSGLQAREALNPMILDEFQKYISQASVEPYY